MIAKKTLLMSAAATTVGVAMFAGVASAQTPSTSSEQPLVDKIAQKFNLDKNKVQEVFDEDKKARETQRQEKLEARLAQAVSDGKITAEQKTAILNKLQEFRDYMKSLEDKPREERKELMKAKHEELKKWAEEQGLSEYFPLVNKGTVHKEGEPAPANVKIEL